MDFHKIGIAFSKARLIASRIAVLCYIVAFFARHRAPLSIVGDLWWLATIGAVVALCGACMRSWAAGVIHKNKALSTTGPYSLARHPLYLGATLIAVGFGLIVNDPYWWALAGLIGLLIYVPTIRREEKRLTGFFPKEWKAFTKRVGVMFPKRFPGKDIRGGWSMKQWLFNHEYNAFFTTIAGVIVLLVWGYLKG
jgi:protein-S-isoprenylcysteine O-methyltransferase Ste14